jgi:hypothetical protein
LTHGRLASYPATALTSPTEHAGAPYFKRRRRTQSLEWLIGMFASQPGFYDEPMPIVSTPVECAAAARPSNDPSWSRR